VLVEALADEIDAAVLCGSQIARYHSPIAHLPGARVHIEIRTKARAAPHHALMRREQDSAGDADRRHAGKSGAGQQPAGSPDRPLAAAIARFAGADCHEERAWQICLKNPLSVRSPPLVAARAHSSLTLDARITLRHFLVSSAISLVKLGG